MPERFHFQGFRSPNYTQVPDEFFDELLSLLSFGELKVLLYVMRRTFGFKKGSDRISKSQLETGITRTNGQVLDRGTGLSRRAIRLAVQSLIKKNILLKKSLESVAAPPPFLGDSPAMKHVLELVATVSASDTTVLITGESGTGKELVARAIHAGSARRYHPMVVVNCGALPEGILESELFGHEAGAFTGARGRHKGKFEAAEGGTVFLDEIGELSAKVQVELLRVLEDKVVVRLGGNAPVTVDFRTIAATNRDLAGSVKAGDFREDLYWRLNVVNIHIPPLRERPEDTPLLAAHFLERFTRAMNRRPMRFSPAALEALAGYPWPGNVRELQNAIERAVVVGQGPLVEPADLPLRITRTPADPGPGSLAEAEKAHILSVLDASGWNISRAARVLDVDRVTLYNKIRKYELKKPDHGG